MCGLVVLDIFKPERSWHSYIPFLPLDVILDLGRLTSIPFTREISVDGRLANPFPAVVCLETD